MFPTFRCNIWSLVSIIVIKLSGLKLGLSVEGCSVECGLCSMTVWECWHVASHVRVRYKMTPGHVRMSRLMSLTSHNDTNTPNLQPSTSNLGYSDILFYKKKCEAVVDFRIILPWYYIERNKIYMREGKIFLVIPPRDWVWSSISCCSICVVDNVCCTQGLPICIAEASGVMSLQSCRVWQPRSSPLSSTEVPMLYCLRKLHSCYITALWYGASQNTTICLPPTLTQSFVSPRERWGEVIFLALSQDKTLVVRF